MITLIVEAALRSLVLAAAVWLGVTAFRLRSPRVARSIWTTVLVGALAMPALMHWMPLRVFPVAAYALPELAIRAVDPGAPGSWYRLVAVVYAAVALALLIRFAIGIGRMSWVRRAALPLHDDWTQGADVRVAAMLKSPAAFGSTILLPASHASWTDAKRAAVLAHECTHVRHRDSQVQWLAALHACIFWFSPLAWWLRWHLAELAEQASDDAVLDGSADRAEYAAVLLEEAQARSSSWVAVSMARGSVARRIERILCDDYRSRSPARWQRVLAIIAVTPVIAMAADAARVATADAPQSQGVADSGAPFGMSPAGPRIVSTPSPEAQEVWFPPQAARRGIDGLVQISVNLDEAGRATDTLVLSEFPPGMGFGAAASGVAHTFEYANPTGHPVSIVFNVKFELKKAAETQTPSPSQSRTTEFEPDKGVDSASP